MRRKRTIAWLGGLLILVLTISVVAQQQQAPPQTQTKPEEKPKTPPMIDQDAIERAHETLFNPQQKASEAASALTSEVAARLPAGAKVSFDPVPRKNFIDEHIFGRMERDKVPHAPLSTDGEFLRRAYLDIAGITPTAEQAREFLDDKDPDKRSKLVDKLVSSEDFIHHQTYYWNDVFRVNVKMGRGKVLWHYWWKENLRVNRSFAEMVREIIPAAGKTNHTVPGIALLSREHVTWKFIPDHPDDYWLLDRLDAFDEYSILLYRAFLGINTSCISCHDGAGHLEPINAHLTQKTRKEFMAQSAFMGKTRMVMSYSFASGLPMCTNYLVMDNTSNGYNTDDDSPWYTPSVTRIPRDGYGTVEPAFLLTGEKPREGANFREELARMLTGHRQFARATVNRLWAQMMTFGIVEPIDEFDLDRIDPKSPAVKEMGLQPSNPELLEALTDEFIKSNYSISHMIRVIGKSNAYQLSATFDAEWKDQYTAYYARKFVRQLTAYELIDSIQVATGLEGEYAVGSKTVSRLTHIASPEDLRGRAGPALDMARAFFLSNRDNPARPRIDGSARQALLLMNSPVVTNRVQARGGTRIEELLRKYEPKDNEKLVEDLYLWSLTRMPSAEEKRIALEALGKPDPAAPAEAAPAAASTGRGGRGGAPGAAGAPGGRGTAPIPQNARTKAAENLAWALINTPEFIFNH